MKQAVRGGRPGRAAEVNYMLLTFLVVAIIGGVFLVRKWFSKPDAGPVVTGFVTADGTPVSSLPMEVMAIAEKDEQGRITFPSKLGFRPVYDKSTNEKGAEQ